MFVHKKRPAIFGLAIILWIALAAPALAGHRIQDSGGGTISLESRGRAPRQASGLAEFKFTKRSGGANGLSIDVKVETLFRRSNKVFEVWLVDEDGGWKSLTVFTTNGDGDADVKIRRNIASLAPYDRIVVTEEDRNGFDTESDEETVLSGRLH